MLALGLPSVAAQAATGLKEPAIHCAEVTPGSGKLFSALLIANSDYLPQSKLSNPANDVELTGNVLKRLGFNVTYLHNANLDGMRKAFHDFAETLKNAPKCSIAFVYFSGMGGLEAETGLEFLFPASFVWESPLRAGAISTDEVLETISSTAPDILRVLVTDGGQNLRPARGYAPKTQNEKPAGSIPAPQRFAIESSTKFLADQQKGLIYVHSAGRGLPAYDSPETRGTLFAQVLAEELGKPGVELVAAFRNVQNKVAQVTAEGRDGLAQYPDLYVTPFPSTYLAGKEQPASIPSGRRLALVIGNQKYAHSVGQLDNPHKDIELVGNALKAIGFEIVPPVKDATRDQILIAVLDFGEQLKAAGPEAIGFIYYSGHGAAIAGQNYIIPVDAEEPSSRILQVKGVSQSEILGKLQETAPAAAQYIVMDACRNNLGGSRGGKGFVAVDNRPGMLIAFATEPGHTASDTGKYGGPYANALATELRKRGQTDLIMFHNVRIQVMTDTNDDQIPWVQDGIRTRSRVFFAGP
jgi:uncharacterized caspase-like protein